MCYQNVLLEDPASNTADGEVSAFFLIEVSPSLGGAMLESLTGTAAYDSATDAQPRFQDPFAPGYENATFAAMGAGRFQVTLERELHIELPVDTDLKLSTLSTRNVFINDFASGDESAWSIGSDVFTFRVSSPDPDVRFTIKADISSPPDAEVLPMLAIAHLPDRRVELSWTAEPNQAYGIHFSGDLAKPLAEWQLLERVTGFSGVATRVFTTNEPNGYYVLQLNP